MERYTVSVLPLAATRFLIPFRPTSSVSELKRELCRRLAKQATIVCASQLQLYLGKKDGPLLDDEDLLEYVVLDALHEELFAIVPSTALPGSTSMASASQAVSQLDIFTNEALDIDEQGFRVRVITPKLAKQQKDISTISLLPGIFSRNTTLRTLHTRISKQLGVANNESLMETTSDEKECNCSFALALVNKTHFKITPPQDDAQTTTGTVFLVIYSKGVVDKLHTLANADQTSLFSQVSDNLQARFSGEWGATRRMKLFVTDSLQIVTVCSKSRHVTHQATAAEDDDFAMTDAPNNAVADFNSTRFTVDLHTAEAPIATNRLDFTIHQLGLEETIVNGILNLFVIIRQVSSDVAERPKGKDGIYLAGSFWELPVKQSERGMAMFLASLRVFCHFFGSGTADDRLRDSVMHIFHRLVAFPPAVRTLHILLNDQTPSLAESAAFAQACYETVQEMVPPRLIGFNNARIFEGARLFFGYLAGKGKAFRLPAEDGTMFPYLASLRTVSLCQSETMEPIAFPVDSNLGLLEQGCFDALSSGVIQFTEAALGPVFALPLDSRTKRAALLSGGHCAEVLMFDIDILYANDKYSTAGKIAGQGQIIESAEMQDVNHLSVLCSRNDLTVVSPRRLASVSAPALTLDRDGLGAVYVGRQPCGNPGKDFLIFRPTRGGEVAIDIAIVAQLLSPILALREADGSAILDALGDPTERKLEVPEEILMICVDCSASMGDPTGFYDVTTEDEEIPESQTPRMVSTLAEIADVEDNPTSVSTPLEEAKEELAAHESFQDIVLTVKETPHYLQGGIATDLLVLLINVVLKNVRSQQETVENQRRRTWAIGHGQIKLVEQHLSTLKKTLIGLIRHKAILSDFIVFRARSDNTTSSNWYWNIGDRVPTTGQLQPAAPRASASLQLAVPENYRCSMTYDLFEDPVTTSDGQRYDRSAIVRWFQIRNTSPLTGLPLADTQLTTDRRMTKDVRDWVSGSDVVTNIEGPPRKKPSVSGLLTINFVSRQGSFERTVSRETVLSAIYELAFRGLRGRYPEFSLALDDEVVLPANSDTVSSHVIKNNSQINISLPTASDSGPGTSVMANTSVSNAELCLIKVYNSRRELLFGIWVPLSSQITFSYLLFKYWRFTLLQSHYARRPELRTPWTDMTDKGDGHASGHIRSLLDKVSLYLNPQHAKGKLEAEAVFGFSSAYNFSDPLVLKFGFYPERPKSSSRPKTTLSRLDALKQMFDQLLNRILAYNYRTHIGLVTINSSANVSQPITHIVEDFRATVNRLEASGDTALWDSLELAKDQIVEYATKYPASRKRILCISDGEDTKSTSSAIEVYPDLVRNGIVVDSFCLGEEDNRYLRTVSFLTDGFIFAPKTLEQAMMICELEPVLDQLERDTDEIVRKRVSCRLPASSNPAGRFYSATGYANAEPLSKDVFPKRKEHPNLQGIFVELVPASRRGLDPANRIGSNLRSSRLLTEIQSIAANPHPHMDVYVSERDMSFWKIVIQSPPDSIYAAGTFVLYLDMEESYPTFAPKCRFVTSIYHPNVNKHGRICHSIFDRNWTSDTTSSMVLSTVYGLLLVPDYSDPVNVVVTLDFHHDQVAFAELAREHIAKHATKSRNDYRRAIVGDT